jgi:hypothetical protein
MEYFNMTLALNLGHVRASAFINVARVDKPPETLRARLAKDIYRARHTSGACDAFPVLYHEKEGGDGLAGVGGQLVNYFDIAALPDDHELKQPLTNIASIMGNWAATRSLQTAPQWYSSALSDPDVSLDDVVSNLSEQNYLLEEAWQVVDDGWFQVEVQVMEIRRRFYDGENPSVFIADVIPFQPSKFPGYLIRDVVCGASESKDGFELWTYVKKERGGYWQLLPAAVARVRMEKIVLDMICRLLGVDYNDLPAVLVRGGATNSVQRLPGLLFDGSLLDKLSGPRTASFLQFSDGIVMDINTMATFAGKPDLHIVRTGFSNNN